MSMLSTLPVFKFSVRNKFYMSLYVSDSIWTMLKTHLKIQKKRTQVFYGWSDLLSIVETRYSKYNAETTSKADMHRLFKITHDIEYPSSSFL